MFWNLHSIAGEAILSFVAFVIAICVMVIVAFYTVTWWHDEVAPKLISFRAHRRRLRNARAQSRAIGVLCVTDVISGRQAKILANRAIDELARQRRLDGGLA